jgi:hypothetical protein
MSAVRAILVEIAPGELLDRIAILELKRERIADPAKLRNVGIELETLQTARDQAVPPSDRLAVLVGELKAVNARLWDIEDDIRRCEHVQDFGPSFIELARAVYINNDHRAALKRQINDLLGSRIVEEKSYAAPG